MSVYRNHIIPRLIDFSMSGKRLSEYRRQTLADAGGEVLEIGFGTGLNLMHYPERVKKITGVDTNKGMEHKAVKRMNASPIEVEYVVLNAESLPMADHTFDTVVSTWTLCSIEHVDQALLEIKRVLKPGGQFLFIEHGLSPEPRVKKWQNRLTPVQKVIADGCRLNRDIERIISKSGLQIEQLNRFYSPATPKFGGYTYQGRGRKT